MNNEASYLTPEGAARLREELEYMKGPGRQELAERLRFAIQQADHAPRVGLGGTTTQSRQVALGRVGYDHGGLFPRRQFVIVSQDGNETVLSPQAEQAFARGAGLEVIKIRGHQIQDLRRGDLTAKCSRPDVRCSLGL